VKIFQPGPFNSVMGKRAVITLGLLLLVGRVGPVNGVSTEEFIFEKPEYVSAAKASGAGNVALLEKLIKEGIDVNYEGKETRTPWGKDTVTLLLWATLSESVKSTEALLRAGADPNKATQSGMTPLIMASGLKNEAPFRLLLITYKADPNKIFRIGLPDTALTVALRERKNLGDKRWDRAETLLKYGGDVNLNIDRGDTALTRFADLEDWRSVLWLLNHGANHETRDRVNATISCTLRNSFRANTLDPSEEYTYRDKVREWLLAHGVAHSRVDPALHPNSKCDD
jgi:ankyrin repeat protein